MSISNGSSPPYSFFDLTYHVLFDRGGMVNFDALTFLVFYIDGFSWNKKIPSSLQLHWALRSMGGVIFGITIYILQNETYPDDPRAPVAWKWTYSLPTIFWYAGELLLDSYPFQKALTIAAYDKKMFTYLAYIGFIPLLLGKIGMIFYRMIYPFTAPNYTTFYQIFNYLDAIMILLAAWSDFLNCLVIIYLGSKTLKLGRSKFLLTLVKATELRMSVSTLLAILSAIFVILNEDCIVTAKRCTYLNARNLAFNIAYTLYYLDYLAIKFFDMFYSNKTLTRSLRQFGVKPIGTTYDTESTDSSEPNITPLASTSATGDFELKKPARMKLRSNVVRPSEIDLV
ncbi:hypothetical protein HK098_000401 [Nowakowskiella sp. JEL0407]|nr:hypothetical protein HK098_000401 [Nowakowskiella sp. JEL0407]